MMDNKTMFDFYKMSYEFGYLELKDIQEAAKWECISKEQYKEIIGKEYIAE